MPSMSVLNIRNLPDEVHRRLRVRAAEAGRSMEAEARAILTAACMSDAATLPASAMQDWVDELYRGGKPRRVVDELIKDRRREAARE
jgi:plasmid stability protein